MRRGATYQVEEDMDNDPGTALVVTKYEETSYLVDTMKFTGYEQVVEEITHDVATQNVTGAKLFTLGHDVIDQTSFTPGDQQAGSPLTFLYDGHGSTRALLDYTAAFIQHYAYTAYGLAIGFDEAQALTAILYSGEWFDSRIGMQNLRARWYDPNIGRFNRLDPFSGNLRDPQSLHKYLYTHGDPVNGWDPSGLMTLNGLLTSMAIGGAIGRDVGFAVGVIRTRVNGGSWEESFWAGADLAWRGALYGAASGVVAYGAAAAVGGVQTAALMTFLLECGYGMVAGAIAASEMQQNGEDGAILTLFASILLGDLALVGADQGLADGASSIFAKTRRSLSFRSKLETYQSRIVGAMDDSFQAHQNVVYSNLVSHKSGNRQVLAGEQIWHLPKDVPNSRIPSADPVGDQLQVATSKVASRYRRELLSPSNRSHPGVTKLGFPRMA